MNRRISSIVIIIAIFTMCFVRVAFDSSPQQAIWIPLVNFLGIPIAVCGIYSQISSRCSRVIKGIFVILFGLLTIIAVLILTGAIVLSALINDLILLITLLITLPSELYCQILSSH